nr:testis anion transporter 1-like [Macaca nemestrina]
MATETSQPLIDMIPYSFLFPVTPDFSVLPKIILQAISLSLVSSFLLIFLGKKIASLHNYSVNSNQVRGLLLSLILNSLFFNQSLLPT